MKTLSVLALMALIASCHFDKLLSGGGGGPPRSHGTPAGLAFNTPPGQAQAGQPLGPVRVAVVDSAGTPVAGADSTITVALATGSGGATLSGTVNVRAVNGVATFSDLRINQPGTYTLRASGGGLPAQDSDPFDVMPPPPTTGSMKVTTATTGVSLDLDGYTVTVTPGGNQPIGATDSVVFSGLAPGSHTVALSGVALNCSVTDGASRDVAVAVGDTARVAFSVSCSTPAPTTGDLTVTTTTGGAGTDPDGYTVSVDGVTKPIATNGSVPFPGLNAGNHPVGLTGVATNCVVSGQNPRTVAVSAGGTAQTDFAITCTAPANQPPIVNAGPDQNPLVGVVGLTLDGASFSDPDHDAPWTVTINWGDGTTPDTFGAPEGAIPGSHTYGTLLPATYTLTITVVDGHGNVGSDTKTVNVHL